MSRGVVVALPRSGGVIVIIAKPSSRPGALVSTEIAAALARALSSISGVISTPTTYPWGPTSRAALAFANDATLRLDQDTSLTLLEEERPGRSWLEMLSGAIHFFSHRTRSLRIDTPFVNAGTEGTEFLMRVAERRTEVVMFEGRVRLTTPEGEILVASGDAAVALAGAAPARQIVVRPRDAVAWALYGLSEGARHREDFERAAVLLEEGLEICRELESKPGIAYLRLASAHVARYQGDLAEARLRYEEALRLLHELGNRRREAICLLGLAAIDVRESAFERALLLMGAVDPMSEGIGIRLAPVDQAEYERAVAAISAGLPKPQRFSHVELERYFPRQTFRVLESGAAPIFAVGMNPGASVEKIPGFYASLRCS